MYYGKVIVSLSSLYPAEEDFKPNKTVVVDIPSGWEAQKEHQIVCVDIPSG